jgi:hypothetical protein
MCRDELGTGRHPLRSVYQSPEDRDGVIGSGMEWGARLAYLQLDEVLEGMR